MKKYQYIIFSVILILFFLGLSMISPGGLYVLDFVITPFTIWQGFFNNTLQWHIVDLINYILWSEITSKLYYIFVFVLWLFTAAKLWKQIAYLSDSSQKKIWIYQSITAIFLLCNPWTYERFVTQPWIAAGMFAVWLWLSYLIENIQNTQKYSLLWASISFGIAFMLFPHASVMILLISIIYTVLYFKSIPWKYYIIAPIVIFAFNFNWIIWSLFLWEELWTRTAATFNRWDIEAFVWNSLSWLWVDLTHLLLYWFWWERYHIITPDSLNEHWYIFAAIWFVFVLYGFIRLYCMNKKLFIFLALLATVSYILWVSIASPLFWWINNWMYENIPWYIGMREPQKWLWITMLCYTIFFVIAVDWVWKKVSFVHSYLMLFIVFVLLNTWNPINIFWYQQQLYGIQIPNEYREIAKIEYEKNPENIYVVFPWHTYMGCTWTRWKNIASMQQSHFYPLRTIVADNIEIAYNYTNSQSPTSENVEKFLQTKDISHLQKENISHIIFQKNCADMSNYTFLDENTEIFEQVEENNFVKIFQINYE